MTAETEITICTLEAQPRSRPKPLPVFPNPAPRPEGSSRLILPFFSPVPNDTDFALGRVPQFNPELFVRTIKSANDRSIWCAINCAGGDADIALEIAIALLEHPLAVHAQIVGLCASAATYFALAADTRSIVTDGRVVIHNARRIYTPEQWEQIVRLPVREKVRINSSLNDTDDAGTALLMQRLGISEQLARGWAKADSKWSAIEALENGFVHSIDAETAS